MWDPKYDRCANCGKKIKRRDENEMSAYGICPHCGCNRCTGD